MRRCSRLICLSAAALFIAGSLGAGVARADFFASGHAPFLTYQQFSAQFTSVTGTLARPFDLTPVAGNDGQVVSQVYKNNSGLFAYLYQIQYTNTTSTSGRITSFTVNWGPEFLATTFPSVTTNPGGGYIYEINANGGTVPLNDFVIPSSPGILIPSSQSGGVDYSDLTVAFGNGGPAPAFTRGNNSDIFVVFSTLHPTTAPLGALSAGAGNGLQGSPPELFVPAPEPASFIGWGLGGCALAVVGFCRLRRTHLALA